MKPGMRKATIWCLAAAVLLLFAALPFLFFVCLPAYLENRLIPELARDAGLPPIQATIGKIGWREAEIIDLKLGKGGSSPLAIDLIKIRYSPETLLQKKISEVIFTGLVLHATWQNGKMRIDWPTFGKPATENRAAMPVSLPDTLPVGRIEIRNARLEIQQEGNALVLPFDGVLQAPSGSGRGILSVFHLYPMGQPITIAAEKTPGEPRVHLSLNAENFHPAAFSPLFPGKQFPGFSGSTDVSATAQIDASKLGIGNVTARISTSSLRVDIAQGDINGRVQPAAGKTARLDIESPDGANWKLSATNFMVNFRQPFSLNHMTVHIRPAAESIQANGHLSATLALPQDAVSTDPRQRNMMPIRGDFSLMRKPAGNWLFSFTGPGVSTPDTNNPVRLAWKKTETVFEYPEIQLDGMWENDHGNARLRIQVPAIRIKTPAGRASITLLQMTGDLSASAEKQALPTIRWDLRTGPVSIREPSFHIDIPAVAVHGNAEAAPSRGPRINGTVFCKNAAMQNPNTPVTASGIEVNIPFTWPPDKPAAQGHIHTGPIVWQNRKIGAARMTVRQQGEGAVFSGLVSNSILPEADITFDGRVGRDSNHSPEAAVAVRLIADYRNRAVPLGKWLPAAREMDIRGMATADGKLLLENGRWSGNAHLQLEDGRLQGPENKYAIEGISLDVSAAHLMHGRTDPSQLLRFKKAAAGTLVFTDGQIEFQAAADGNALIEKARWKWCGGTMSAQSFRIVPGRDNYHLNFYADRLNLIQILNQLGAAQAEGDGTVNGTIPVRMENGKIHLDDGFLYSTPGVGGKIQLIEAQKLLSGVDGGHTSLGQIALATEALKDYDYQWVKLRMLSEGEDLKLMLQFDGKPAQPLPFIYDEKIGGFARVQAGSPGSVFQGIRLDINFNLPLNQLLQYRNLLEMME